MKIRHLILGLCVGIIVLGGCDDEWSSVGTSIQEDGDKISVNVDTFRFEASTVRLDSVYARTTSGLLGEIYDPVYGMLKSDYISQFYCPEDFRFAYTPKGGKIDSVEFRIYYTSWAGDSLVPMRVQVYLIDKPLEKHFYTNVNPADYCNMQKPLGSKAYTAYDRSVPDSVRSAMVNGEPTFYPQINITLPQELGQKFYDETLKNPASFDNQEAFNRFFPGLYVTNTFGSGNVINVDLSYLHIYYSCIVEGSAGQDSLVSRMEKFNVTQEVIQLNRFQHTDMSNLLQPDEDFTYLKTPAGVSTRIVIPASQIASAVKGRILNNVPFEPSAMPQESYDYALTVPPYLLVLPEDSVKSFFENGSIEDNNTSYLFAYNASTRTYLYSQGNSQGTSYSVMNLSNLLKYQRENAPGKDLVLLAIPVSRQTTTDGYENIYTTSLSHYLYPSGVKLRKDAEKRNIVVTSSKYGGR
ncbi:hypothetical protein Barb7_00164 [Bacteroidales bacterium Barb7]|nr:hypothetical protein Barb7_00164 [Bacteroidales bacterium Barb7]